MQPEPVIVDQDEGAARVAGARDDVTRVRGV